MSDVAVQGITAVIIALIGVITTYITVKARSSSTEPEAAPVTNEQVRGAEDPGVMALKIAMGTQRQLEETKADLETTKAALIVVRDELRSVLAELESIARDLRRFVEWEEAGAHGNPPITLTEIYARLEALTRKRPPSHDRSN